MKEWVSAVIMASMVVIPMAGAGGVAVMFALAFANNTKSEIVLRVILGLVGLCVLFGTEIYWFKIYR